MTFCVFEVMSMILQENAEGTEIVDGVGPAAGPAVISGAVPFDSQWLPGVPPGVITQEK